MKILLLLLFAAVLLSVFSPCKYLLGKKINSKPGANSVYSFGCQSLLPSVICSSRLGSVLVKVSPNAVFSG